MAEPIITINGQACTQGEAMTLRVAIESFASDLRENGLGEDETGKALTLGYLRNIDLLRLRIFGS